MDTLSALRSILEGGMKVLFAMILLTGLGLEVYALLAPVCFSANYGDPLKAKEVIDLGFRL